MNLLQLKKVFDLNKDKTISLNDKYYIFIFKKDDTTVNIYDNDILNHNEIAQIFYSDTEEVWLALAKEESGILYKNKIKYSLTDSIDKLDLSPDLLEVLKEKCMKNQLENKLSFEERQIRRRNQKVNQLRFMQGIKELFSKKLKFIIFSLYIIISIFIWFLFIYNPNDYKNIIRLLVYILFWLVFGIFASGILMLFGKPKKAQEIEDDMKDALKIEKAHKVPILASIFKKNTNISTNIITYKFYSPDYSKDKYEEKRTDIEQKLGIKILDKIESDRDFIYFDAIFKKNIKPMGELKDDRI